MGVLAPSVVPDTEGGVFLVTATEMKFLDPFMIFFGTISVGVLRLLLIAKWEGICRLPLLSGLVWVGMGP